MHGPAVQEGRPLHALPSLLQCEDPRAAALGGRAKQGCQQTCAENCPPHRSARTSSHAVAPFIRLTKLWTPVLVVSTGGISRAASPAGRAAMVSPRRVARRAGADPRTDGP